MICHKVDEETNSGFLVGFSGGKKMLRSIQAVSLLVKDDMPPSKDNDSALAGKYLIEKGVSKTELVKRLQVTAMIIL